MIALNPNWTPWVISSINSFFKDAFEESSILIQYATQNLTDNEKHSKSSWLEIRIDGPWFFQVHGYYNSKTEVNVLISSLNPNNYFVHKQMGEVAAAMGNRIPLNEWNLDTGVKGDLIGCLMLSDKRNEKIRSSYFGIVHQGTEIEQATVESSYIFKFRS